MTSHPPSGLNSTTESRPPIFTTGCPVSALHNQVPTPCQVRVAIHLSSGLKARLQSPRCPASNTVADNLGKSTSQAAGDGPGSTRSFVPERLSATCSTPLEKPSGKKFGAPRAQNWLLEVSPVS